MSNNPLNAVAPFPATETEATATAVAKHLTVQAFLSSLEARALAPEVEAGAPREVVTAYADASTRMTDQFSAAFLLRSLHEVAPESADLVARQLWWAWQDGGSVHEWLHEWMVGLGVDPVAVEQAAMVGAASAGSGVAA